MTSGIESEPVFKARALQIGLTSPEVQILLDAGVGTMGAFSFGSAFQPGQPDEAPLIDFFRSHFSGGSLTAALTGRLRRLYYEAHTLVLSDMKSRIERSEDDQPRKMQAPERAQRLLNQKNRLTGVNISGEMEPSYALIDKVADQYEHAELRYIPVEDLTTREQELTGEKKDPALNEYIKKSKQGALTVAAVGPDLKADTSTELKLKNALLRRALAYDQCSLISYEYHEQWIAKIFSKLSEEQPVGYAMISIEQILRADKKLFVKMSEECRAGIVGLPGMPRPLDQSLVRLMDHTDVAHLLQPLLGGSSSSGKKRKWNEQQAPSGGGGQQVQATKGKGRGKGQKGKGKGKGGKGKGQFKRTEGCASWTADGRQIGFGFNSHNGCGLVVTAGRCPRGWHVCGWAPCHGQHAIMQCNYGAAAAA